MKRLQKVEAAAPESAATDGRNSPSPQPAQVAPSPTRSKIEVDTSTPSPVKKVIRSEERSSLSPSQEPGTKLTPKKVDPQLAEALRIDRDARALNMSLEYSLQLTFRSEAAVDSIRYVGQEGTSGTLLNSTNISELICSHLTEQNESAIAYLTGCYKRIVQKESAASPAVATELAR